MEMVRFQIMSDLHLETPKSRPSYRAFEMDALCPNLALLGDIGSVDHHEFFEFLELQVRRFDHVFYLLGNHEPYGSTYTYAIRKLSAFEDKVNGKGYRGKFVFLNRTVYRLDGAIILGCTLHSAITAEQTQSVSMFVSDFSEMDSWTVETHNRAHAEDLNWLNAQVLQISQTPEDQQRPVIIFTHHSPTMDLRANDPRHIQDASEVNSAFVTDLSDQVCWTYSRVVLWAFGHTHFNCDWNDDKTSKRVFANQKGYRRSENISFDVELVVEISTTDIR